MKKWVKKLSYYATGAAFIAAGIMVGRVTDVSAWWPVAMGVIGFALNAIGGFFVQPDQP